MSVSGRSPWEQQQHQLHPQQQLQQHQHLQQQLQQLQQQQQGPPVHSNGLPPPEKPSLWSCLDSSGDASTNRCGLCSWKTMTKPAAMSKSVRACPKMHQSPLCDF